ncbi:Ethanolamine-phosphate cytidylyltransferase [Arachis hypogaea]|nr:Ethanolamine-phosphate cytidylyltransferase [Arachis hypogaea]
MTNPWSNLGIFTKKRSGKRCVRVYMDGCFDLMHYGHANALRQAKALGDELVAGLGSDEEILANKGPSVFGLKWVDEVITDAPYAITEEFLNHLFYEYNIDYVIPGDDPCLLPDGTDAYAAAKKAGRYKQIKRTEGVSNIDIVGPGPDARIVYIDGAFDLFHAGHVEILKKARQLGDFLLVGIHSDETVRFWDHVSVSEMGKSLGGERELSELAPLFSLLLLLSLEEEEEEEEEVGEKSMRYPSSGKLFEALIVPPCI